MGKRLQPALLATARHLQRRGELQLSPQVEHKLARISTSSIDRLLARRRNQLHRRLPRKPPAPFSPALAQVIPWDERQLGYPELDLLWRCSRSTDGDLLYTWQAIAVATAGANGMSSAAAPWSPKMTSPCERSHTDNGPEFLSAHIFRFWPKLVSGTLLTRNQPWRKNDSRFVEQKNFTLVRAYLG